MRYFRPYQYGAGGYSYHPVDSAHLKGWRTWHPRLLVWAASKLDLYLCIRKDEPLSKTIELDVTKLLPLIHEQLLNCQRDRYQPTKIVVGRPVEFVLTSKDTTHGFGVTTDNYDLLFQAQIVPDHTQLVVHTFTKPGIYRIVCLEYCGVLHHTMLSQFEVTQ